uniref:Uncharacterized protein n=1 Tax=Cucumis melo TaxID=3656 RepID=A0A9I9EEF0_CUCME
MTTHNASTATHDTPTITHDTLTVTHRTPRLTHDTLTSTHNVSCFYLARCFLMRYIREIVSKDTNIITDAIDMRSSYSKLKLDEERAEWTEFLAWYI